jgi:putative ATPase
MPARKDRAPQPLPATPHPQAGGDLNRPLADRIRPTRIADYIGQRHLLGEGKPIAQMLVSGRFGSLLLWGPPGVGKTTLARLLAAETGREFYELSAVNAGKDEIRRIVEAVRAERNPPRDLFTMSEPAQPRPAPVLFLDEIHRFNKAQQDFLLPYVEDGTVLLIGATTENPSFEVIPALLSRMRVYVLEAHGEDEIRRIIARGADVLGFAIAPDAADYLVQYAGGDARQALNLLETAAALYRPPGDAAFTLTADPLREAAQSKHLRYDKAGEEHYNTISAFIKSMRAGQPNAAVYYLARMVAAGEDPKFIARRMVIFASEDVGMADPHALNVANSVFRAVEIIGYPEAGINLAHGVVYLACAPKDRSSYDAYQRALDDVKAHGSLPVPLIARNASTALMGSLGYGEGYTLYTETPLLPDALRDRVYYTPPDPAGDDALP